MADSASLREVGFNLNKREFRNAMTGKFMIFPLAVFVGKPRHDL